MLISSCKTVLVTALGGWGMANALLYLARGTDYRLPLPLPDLEDVPLTTLSDAMDDLGLGMDGLGFLHFDRITSALEVLCLPLDLLTGQLLPTQLIELVMHPVMEPVLDNTYLKRDGRRVRDKKLMKQKMRAFYQSLGSLTPQVLGDLQDRVVERIPGRLYRFLAPLTVLTAQTARISVRNLQNLFHLTARTLLGLGKRASRALGSVFGTLKRLGITPTRILQVTELLLQLVVRHPELASMAPRVYLLATEVEQITGFINNHAGILQAIGTHLEPLLAADTDSAMDTSAKRMRATTKLRHGWLNQAILKESSRAIHWSSTTPSHRSGRHQHKDTKLTRRHQSRRDRRHRRHHQRHRHRHHRDIFA